MHINSAITNQNALARLAAISVITRVTRSQRAADQIKANLRRQGKTISQWAEEHGYSRNSVYRVLNGIDKAHYGRAHEIAVKLGLKSDQLAA